MSADSAFAPAAHPAPLPMSNDHYLLAGNVERGYRGRYRRLPGYSLIDPQSGNTCQPWVTLTEARAGSKAAGRDPIFHPDEATARRSIACEQQEGRP